MNNPNDQNLDAILKTLLVENFAQQEAYREAEKQRALKQKKSYQQKVILLTLLIIVLVIAGFQLPSDILPGCILAIVSLAWVLYRLYVYCSHFPYSRRIFPGGPFGDWL